MILLGALIVYFAIGVMAAPAAWRAVEVDDDDDDDGDQNLDRLMMGLLVLIWPIYLTLWAIGRFVFNEGKGHRE